MTVRVESIPAYTFPQELLTFEVGDAMKTELKSKYVDRDIYLQTPLLPLEEQLLTLFNKMCQQMDIWLPRSMRARALRYITVTKGDVNKAVQLCLETMRWRSSFFSDAVSDHDLIFREQLAEGILYICGRDSAMRPIVVCRMKEAIDRLAKWRSEDVIRLVSFILEFMGRYMFLPGKVEKYSVLLDMTGVGLWTLLHSKGPPKELTEILRHHYVKILKHVYVVGLSNLTPMLWTTFCSVMLKGMNDQQKFIFLTDVKDLRKYSATTQLEKKYGGQRDNITSYYPWTFVPGPFTAGYDGEPNYKSHASVHKALVRETTIGHIWTSVELNDVFTSAELLWSRDAPAIFQQIGMTNKPLVKRAERSPKKADRANKVAQSADTALMANVSHGTHGPNSTLDSGLRPDATPASLKTSPSAVSRSLTPPPDHLPGAQTLKKQSVSNPADRQAHCGSVDCQADCGSVSASHFLAKKVDEARSDGSELEVLAKIDSVATTASKPGNTCATESSSGVPDPSAEQERQRVAEAPIEKAKKKGGGCCRKA